MEAYSYHCIFVRVSTINAHDSMRCNSCLERILCVHADMHTHAHWYPWNKIWIIKIENSKYIERCFKSGALPVFIYTQIRIQPNTSKLFNVQRSKYDGGRKWKWCKLYWNGIWGDGRQRGVAFSDNLTMMMMTKIEYYEICCNGENLCATEKVLWWNMG